MSARVRALKLRVSVVLQAEVSKSVSHCSDKHTALAESGCVWEERSPLTVSPDPQAQSACLSSALLRLQTVLLLQPPEQLLLPQVQYQSAPVLPLPAALQPCVCRSRAPVTARAARISARPCADRAALTGASRVITVTVTSIQTHSHPVIKLRTVMIYNIECFQQLEPGALL